MPNRKQARRKSIGLSSDQSQSPASTSTCAGGSTAPPPTLRQQSTATAPTQVIMVDTDEAPGVVAVMSTFVREQRHAVTGAVGFVIYSCAPCPNNIGRLLYRVLPAECVVTLNLAAALHWHYRVRRLDAFEWREFGVSPWLIWPIVLVLVGASAWLYWLTQQELFGACIHTPLRRRSPLCVHRRCRRCRA
jgi:hypothetical protein